MRLYILGTNDHRLMIFFALFSFIAYVFASVISQSSLDYKNLHILGGDDNIICNDQNCYPKVFEPTNYWKIVEKLQQLPAGLEVRMNMDTGVKEARLSQSDVNLSPQIIEKESVYQFSKNFQNIRNIISREECDYNEIDTILDDVIEFAHDYKYGFEIIKHEFHFLIGLALNNTILSSTRDLSARIIISCLRNNPPAIKFVNDHYPDVCTKIVTELSSVLSTTSSQIHILVKRYLSIIQVLTHLSGQTINEHILLQLYNIEDKDIRIKILEIISRIYEEDKSNVFLKKSLESGNLQKWFDAFNTMIQSYSIDEFHLRIFFQSMYKMKEVFPSEIHVSSSFLKWLADESENRKTYGLQKRDQDQDPEQEVFDGLLIKSRHLIFGNPKAHRIKNFDEL